MWVESGKENCCFQEINIGESLKMVIMYMWEGN